MRPISYGVNMVILSSAFIPIMMVSEKVECLLEKVVSFLLGIAFYFHSGPFEHVEYCLRIIMNIEYCMHVDNDEY